MKVLALDPSVNMNRITPIVMNLNIGNLAAWKVGECELDKSGCSIFSVLEMANWAQVGNFRFCLLSKYLIQPKEIAVDLINSLGDSKILTILKELNYFVFLIFNLKDIHGSIKPMTTYMFVDTFESATIVMESYLNLPWTDEQFN